MNNHPACPSIGNPACQRNFSGGGDGGSTTASPSSPFDSGKSFKKVVSNAQGAQTRVTGQNGAHIQPPLSGTPDVSISTGPTVNAVPSGSTSTAAATGPATPVSKPRKDAGTLNKLTPPNFEKLFEQVKQVNIDNAGTLSGVIDQIYDKALMEPTFVEMYADFCSRLAFEFPDFIEDNEKITFKRLLLNKCQVEFERGDREQAEANRTDEEGEMKQTEEQREEKRVQARQRKLGNIILMGELYKKKMLTERIMHECIKKLFGEDYINSPDEENIESLCQLMSTIGGRIDHAKAKQHMDVYFNMMSKLSDNMKLSSRVRFMLKDVIDLRKNRWQQRRNVEGPEKIEQVHRDVAQERQAQSNRLARWPKRNPSMRRGQGQPMDSKGSNLLPNPQTGYRGLPQQHHRGYGNRPRGYGNRHRGYAYSFENRTLLVPVWPVGYDYITLGLQGGPARGRWVRGQQVKHVIIDNAGTLSMVIDQMFDMAIMEPTFVEMYADVFSQLAVELPDFSEDNEKITFKRLLLNNCQEEFERGDREQAEANRTEEEVKQTEEQRVDARRRKLGNIRLIGELYKKKMLTERIMHECIKKLFGEDYNNPDEENIESLCKLLSTIGGMIDHAKAKEHMDVYFDMMSKLSDNMKLSSRVRCILKDVIDLRMNRWQQRREVEGPKKIEEVHLDAAHKRRAQSNRLARWPVGDNKRSCTKVHKQGNRVGRAVDLSKMSSYGELFMELEGLFNMEGAFSNSDGGWRLLYTDEEDDMMVVGDDPWDEFARIATKIHVNTAEEVEKLMSSGVISDNTSCLEALVDHTNKSLSVGESD